MIVDLLKKISQPKKIRQAILFAMHFPSNGALDEFQRIKESCAAWGDCLISYDNRDAKPIDPAILREAHWIFSEQELAGLGYYVPTGVPLIPGGNHWPVIRFSQHNNYDYYWNIEYDVRFAGDWKDFFSHFSKAKDDFITSHIRKYKQETYWYYWSTLSHPELKIDQKQYLRSFNPIYRISNRALQYIDQMHKQRWRGHHEALIATLLHQGRFSLRDFGGTGRFVHLGERNLFYIDSINAKLCDGSMRYRPEIESTQGYYNKLVHPVK